MHTRKPGSNRSSFLACYARKHRFAMTDSEAALWHELRAKKLSVLFRRQVPLGSRFIADFLAPAAALIVEVDGGWHASRGRADERRDENLRRLGYRTLRIDAELVRRDLGAAVALVRAALGRPP